MSKRIIIALLCQVIRLEDNATSPEQRKYWTRHWRKLNKLAVEVGWLD